MLDLEIWASLITLTTLEIVLGIDNIVFLSILTGKLPIQEQPSARVLGLALAMISRICLLVSLTFIMSFHHSLFSVFGQDISGRDLVLILGGLFLIYKATREVHSEIEGAEKQKRVKGASFAMTLVQIMILDIVFSLDSVITAVGMAKHLWIMITAIVVAAGFMMWMSNAVFTFINTHPTIKMLALSFLLLVGMVLVGDGFGQHLPRGYVYFAMGFSMFVEFLNSRARRKQPTPMKVRAGARSGVRT